MPGFPVAFRPPAFASWASCSRQGFPPLLRSAYRASQPGPDGFSTFHTSEIQPDWAPSSSRGQRCSHGRPGFLGRRLPPLPTARPYHPGPRPITRSCSLRDIHKGLLTFARPAFPSPGCSPGWSRGPWASSLGFAPQQVGPAAHARAGTGIEHSPGATRPTSSASIPASSLEMSGFVSHGQSEHMIGLVIRQVDLQQLQAVIDRLDQAQP